MALYLLTPLAANIEKLDAVILQKVIEKDRFRLASSAGWLVSFQGTSVELSNFLGITGQAEGEKPLLTGVLVTSIGTYYGRGSSEMWEWLKTRAESAA